MKHVKQLKLGKKKRSVCRKELMSEIISWEIKDEISNNLLCKTKHNNIWIPTIWLFFIYNIYHSFFNLIIVIINYNYKFI